MLEMLTVMENVKTGDPIGAASRAKIMEKVREKHEVSGNPSLNQLRVYGGDPDIWGSTGRSPCALDGPPAGPKRQLTPEVRRCLGPVGMS